MKLRFVFALLVLFCTTSLFAQGYKDGVEYYKVNQFEKAKILLNRNLNNADTDKALAYYYLGQVAMAEGNVAEARLASTKVSQPIPKMATTMWALAPSPSRIKM